MPLVRLIFFEDPREFTEAQIKEARLLGHLNEEHAAGPRGARPGPLTSPRRPPDGRPDPHRDAARH